MQPPGLPELASALFSAVCVWASARRLAWAVAPTALDHTVLVDALRTRGGEGARDVLAPIVAGVGGWEKDLLDAAAEPVAEVRSALINEQLAEFEALVGRWAGVPRVCARLATSAGFLCATVALLEGLATPAGDEFTEHLHAALMGALSSLAVGIAGTSFCVAVHFRARRAGQERARAADRLVEVLVGTGVTPT